MHFSPTEMRTQSGPSLNMESNPASCPANIGSNLKTADVHFSNMRILVVDDEEHYRAILQIFLQNNGHACDVAANAGEAMDRLSNGKRFDLVISDLRMSDKNGLELMLEAKQTCPDLDFIIMTGYASEYCLSDIITQGAFDYVCKPFDMGELNAKLRRLQREKVLLNQLREANEALSWEAEVNLTLAQLSTKLMELESLDEITLLVLQNAKRLTGSRLGYIGYVDAETGAIISPELTCNEASHGCEEDLRKAFEDLAQWALRHGESILANGFEDPELLGISSDGYFPMDRILSVPAIANGEVLGQIVLANSFRDYTGQDEALLQSLAGIYALATQHLQVAIKLRRTNDYMENIFENSPDAIGIVDKHGKFLKWNRMAAELYGYTLDELKEKTAFDLYADKNEFKKMIARLWAEGSVKKHEMDMTRKDGTVATFELSIGLLNDPVYGNLGSVCVVRDLGPLRKVVEELRRTNTEMSQLVASIPSFLIELDSNNRITRWNDSAEKTFGIPGGSVLGTPLEECGIRWNWRKVSEAVSKCEQIGGAGIQLEDLRFWRPDGKRGFLDVMISSVATADDSSTILLLGSDVTKRKILESQLVQAQKLESIGQLAAGIAHEINTPAQYVGDNVRFLQEAFSDLENFQQHFDLLLETAKTGEPTEDLIRTVENAAENADLQYLRQEIPKAVEQSLEGIERISKIVRAMKEFSHPGTDAKTNLDLNKAIESTITVARNEWKYVADMATDFDPSLPLVPCLPGEFNQVILNMIINASHAIAEKLGKGSQEKGTITVGTHLRGDWAEVRISDTGSGIPKEIRSKIFDPFFTTKEVGKGTGQGLAISHSVIIDKHGGTIDFESEIGKGTTFIIRLPILTLPDQGIK